MDKVISKELEQQIIEYAKANDVEYYFDYNEELSKEQIRDLFKDGTPIQENLDLIINDINFYLWDEIANIEDVIINNFMKENDIEEDLRDDVTDIFRNHVTHVINWDDLFKRASVNIVVRLHSNYDCQASGYYTEYIAHDTYVSDVFHFLKINPQQFKKQLKNNTSIDFIGKFPNIKSRNGKNVVDFKELDKEFQNNTCPSVFTFVVNMPVLEAIELFKNRETATHMIIKEDTVCGFFCDFQGGGSNFECRVLQDTKIKIEKDKYSKLYIAEESNIHHYTMDNVYGVYDSYFSKGGFELI